MKKHTHDGFTLIELLVVISIIGVLSSVVLVSLNSARIKARDSIRKQELTQIRNALEIYYTSHGSYPNTGSTWGTSFDDGCSYSNNNAGDWIPGLVASGAIGSLPIDPSGQDVPSTISGCEGWCRGYLYQSDGTNYKLLSHCAPEGTWNQDDGFYDSVRPTWAWQVTNNPTATVSW